MTDDSEITRRDFLRGGFFKRDSPARPQGDGESPGKKRPVYTAVVAVDGDDIEAERRRAREVLGKIREPDQKPLDVLSFIAGYDVNNDGVRPLLDDDDAGRWVAHIQPYYCLAHLGTLCTVCHERCPEPGAIELIDQRPRVNPELCTDCGICAKMCPAAGGAITFSRLRETS